MKTSDIILIQLATEQSTESAIVDSLPEDIAAALKQPAAVVAAYLCDLEKDGYAKSYPLGDPAVGRKLATWRITPAGRTRVEELNQPAAP